MANEIAVRIAATWNDLATGIKGDCLPSIGEILASTTGDDPVIAQLYTVPTTAGGVVVPIGTAGAGGILIVYNTDATNYLSILTATSGTTIADVLPRSVPAVIPLPSGVSAPAWVANTAATLALFSYLPRPT